MSVQCETTARRAAGAQMPFFEKYLSAWVALCIVAGIALGRLFPTLFDTLGEHRVELIILNCDRYADSVRAVIKQKHRFNPEVPVIAMAADADEKAIQEALLHGACDLVSTGRKRRLQAVVSRELRALRVERALNSTLTSVTSYRKQVRHYMRESTNAIAVVAEGIIVEANESWLKLFKLKAFEDIDGTTFVALDGGAPKKLIVVPGRIVNVVV